ncbi:MAG: hypothetical protein ABI867_15405 [Kofleriaceae bacterium]
MESFFDPVAWVAQARAFCEQARTGRVTDDYVDVQLPYSVAAWPQPWIAADLLTHDIGSARDAELCMLLNAENALTVTPEGSAGDVDALLAAGDLEGAYRACFAPELAEVIEARDAHVPITKLEEPKKKSELEKLWSNAAVTLSPRSAFAGTWPSKWKDAQRRMRVLYARPRSPLLAAAAIAFADREDLGYTSIAAGTFWQAICWFIAEQGDVRQLAALEAIERRVCAIEGRKELFATPALRAFTPRPLTDRTRATIAALAVAKPAVKPALSLASEIERGVAADQMLLDGDPRGELIVVQQQIAARGPTKELLKQQKQLLKKHAKAWCPSMVDRETCIFRGGVPVAGRLQFHSDVELRSFVGAKALATFETLEIPGAAMGPIEPATIATVVRSLPGLRRVITTDEAGLELARGAACEVEHLTLEGARALPAKRPGLPKLRRVDGVGAPDIAIVGTTDPTSFANLAKQHAVVVLADESGWELWAENQVVTARPLPGAKPAGLDALLASADLTREAIVIDPTDPATLGYALSMK